MAHRTWMSRLHPLPLLIALATFWIASISPSLSFADTFPEGRWIDLSHDFADDTLYWPTADKFHKSTVFEGETEQGFFYSAYNVAGAEHGGTHVDAPVHFARNHPTVDRIPLEQLIGPGIVIRVADQVGKQNSQDRNYLIAIADIERWEQRNGKIPEGTIVLFDTGTARYWPDAEKYMGTAERGEAAVAKLNFPGLSPEAAIFLAEKRGIKAVGLDTPSIDYGASKLFKTHRELFRRNVPALENVANLKALPDKGFTLIALPMKIRGGSGGPTRIVAFIPQQ